MVTDVTVVTGERGIYEFSRYILVKVVTVVTKIISWLHMVTVVTVVTGDRGIYEIEEPLYVRLYICIID